MQPLLTVRSFLKDHRLSIDAGSKSEPRDLNHFLEKSNVTFSIGCRFTKAAYAITVPENKTVIHSTLDAGDVDKGVKSDYSLIGDAKLMLELIRDELVDRLDRDPRGCQDEIAAEIPAVMRNGSTIGGTSSLQMRPPSIRIGLWMNSTKYWTRKMRLRLLTQAILVISWLHFSR